MADESRKRSRFGDEPAEPPRKSKFDRRSRSPERNGTPKTDRNRSPVPKSKEEDASASQAKSEAVARAAAAAAKINAMLSQKKLEQPARPPPIQLTPTSAPKPADGNGLSTDVYQQDGDFIKDIEINDLKNRYVMTKGPTQKMIKEETGADVTTRGSYYPDKRLATSDKPPLYLHVTSTTKEGFEKAVAKIEELMAQDLPDLVDQRRFRRGRDPDPDVELDSRGRRKWPEEHIPVDLEPIPNFNLRAAVVGTGGANVKHIQAVSGCRIQIKGRGSGYLDSETGRESDENMYLSVSGPDPEMLAVAKEQCISLLASVRENYEAHKESRARNNGGGYGGGHGDRRDGYQGGRGQQSPQEQQGYGGGAEYGNAYGDNSGYGQANAYGTAGFDAQQQATAAAWLAMPADQLTAWRQYYAATPHEDPWVHYGGFEAYLHSINAYAANGGMAGSPSQVNGAGGPPPPPPGQNSGIPPPPPPPA